MFKGISLWWFVFVSIETVSSQCNYTTSPMILNATAFPQYLTSPNYPDKYPSDSDCAWLIITPSVYDRIIINVEDLFTEKCSTDYLAVYDGDSKYSTMKTQLCAANYQSFNELSSKSGSLYCEFKSDSRIEYTGFKLLYFMNDSATQAPCAARLSVYKAVQVLMSPNLPHPYSAKHSCWWSFSSDTGNGINFRVKFLDVVFSNKSCDVDSLTFYDGNTTAAPILAKICRSALKFSYSEMWTTGDDAIVMFNVTGDGTLTNYGFMLTYKTIIDNWNTALNKTAVQTNTVPGYEAEKAVDGVVDSHCTLTNTSSDAAWEVDLGDYYVINHVIVYIQPSCCVLTVVPELSDMELYVGFTRQDYILVGDYPGVLYSTNYTFFMETETVGRWVKINRTIATVPLSLCEVRVMGYEYQSEGLLLQPDFSSNWLPIASDDNYITVEHKLGETPLLVDVQVKAIDGPNAGYIFQASGHQFRHPNEAYGNVVYIYNDVDVIVAAPKSPGRCIYTGPSPYWQGPNQQDSTTALVRVRAWKSSSLPEPDFTHSGSTLTAMTGIEFQNVALNKMTIQTDTFDISDVYQSCTIQAESFSSWEVDLQDTYNISQVTVYNRKDCCQYSLSDVEVYIGTTQSTYVLQGSLPGTITSNYTFVLPNDTIGRWLKMAKTTSHLTERFTLCNVEVTGYQNEQEILNINITKTDKTNILPCKWSSSNAVDGVFDGSCAVAKSFNSSWEVDLEDDFIINSVVVYHRTDCCDYTLANVEVYVGTTQDSYVLQGSYQGPVEGNYTFKMSAVIVKGRWVKITRPADVAEQQYLVLCEVQVMGYGYQKAANNSYIEADHNLGQHPAFVISRIQNPQSASKYPGYFVDSIGASQLVFLDSVNQTNGYVVYGVSSSSIRIWAPFDSSGYLFSGDGSFGLDVSITTANLSVYAWNSSTLTPNITASKILGLNVSSSNLYQTYSNTGLDDSFTRAWVHASTGINEGFQFIGSGSLAYDTSTLAHNCTYGGLTYAYSENTTRFWQPGTENGALICIYSHLGIDMNTQSSNHGTAYTRVWNLDFDDCKSFPCNIGSTCMNWAWGYDCICASGWTGYNCDIVTPTTTTTTSTVMPNTSSSCSKSGLHLEAPIFPNYDWIESENFNYSNYNRLTDCVWYIKAIENYAVEVQFDNQTFNIEYNLYCLYDYIALFDVNGSTTMMNKFCGNSISDTKYRSSGEEMIIVFHSDYAITRKGFRLKYRAVDNSYPACKAEFTQYPTTFNIEFEYLNTTFTTNYGIGNYPTNIEIFWLFTNDQAPYYKMVLELTDINIEQSKGCRYDRLILYDGPCQKYPVMDTICGQRKKRWDLNGTEYLMQFHSDNSFTNKGFMLQYYTIPFMITPPEMTITTTMGAPLEDVVNFIKDALVNYASDVAPNRDVTEPIKAYVDFYLVGINGLDEVQQKLTTTVMFHVRWRDESLAWDPFKRAQIVRMLVPQTDIWRPDIVLINGFTKIVEMGASFMLVDVNYNGSAVWMPYQIMDSVCKVDMSYYPYDTQICVLKFGTWSSSSNEIEVDLGMNGLQIHSSFEQDDLWQLKNTSTQQETINGQKIVKFYLVLERNSKFVTFYMTIPIIMLGNLNVFMFVIPTGSGEKSGFGATVFLSFIILLIVIQYMMPKNSDTISLYAAYVLCMTLFSGIGQILIALQARAFTLNSKQYPIPEGLKTIVIKIHQLQYKFLWNKSKNKDFIKTRKHKKRKKRSNKGKKVSTSNRVDNKWATAETEYQEDYRTAPLLHEQTVIGSELQREVTTAAIKLEREKTEYVKVDSDFKEKALPVENCNKHVRFEDEAEVHNMPTQCDNSNSSVKNIDQSEFSQNIYNVPNRIIVSASKVIDVDSTRMDESLSVLTARPVSRESNRHLSRDENCPTFRTDNCRPLSRGESWSSFRIDNSQPLSKGLSQQVSSLNNHPMAFVSQTKLQPRAVRMQSLHDNFPSLEETDDNNNQEHDSESDNSSNLSDDWSEDNGPTWQDLVNVTDAIIFTAYLIVTTIMTLSFFLPMM